MPVAPICRACGMCQAPVSLMQALCYLIFTTALWKVGAIVTYILQMSEPRLREVKQVPRFHFFRMAGVGFVFM